MCLPAHRPAGRALAAYLYPARSQIFIIRKVKHAQIMDGQSDLMWAHGCAFDTTPNREDKNKPT